MLKVHGEESAEDATTIHGEGRKKIEKNQDDIDGEKLAQNVAFSIGDPTKVVGKKLSEDEP